MKLGQNLHGKGSHKNVGSEDRLLETFIFLTR